MNTAYAERILKILEEVVGRAREMAKQLGALADLAEDRGLIPSTHVVAHSCL